MQDVNEVRALSLSLSLAISRVGSCTCSLRSVPPPRRRRRLRSRAQDATEHDRLELQSFAQYLALEGNYPPTARDAVRAALAPRPGRRAAVLDVGTGSAAWAVAMAREFPHADVLGVDLVPVVRTGYVPLPPLSCVLTAQRCTCELPVCQSPLPARS